MNPFEMVGDLGTHARGLQDAIDEQAAVMDDLVTALEPLIRWLRWGQSGDLDTDDLVDSYDRASALLAGEER